MKELNLEETKIVSGGHNSLAGLHEAKGNPHTDGVPGVAEVLDLHHWKLPGPQTEGGWGKGGING